MSYSKVVYASPIGPLTLVEKNGALCGVILKSMWPTFAKRFTPAKGRVTPILKTTTRQLDEYFAGRRRSFDLPLKLAGTAFQKMAWGALAEIPYGSTKTYREQAQAIRSPKAFRAVGHANGLNPFCIVLPCHRVVGSDGSLTGYAGGLAAKRFLLALEGSELGGK